MTPGVPATVAALTTVVTVTVKLSRLAQVNLNQFPLIVRLDPAGQPTLSAPTSGDVQSASGHLLADVATAAAKGTWSRLKIRGAQDCR